MWVWRVVEDLRDGVVVEGQGEIVLPEPIKRRHCRGCVAVEIELKATLKARNLLISLNRKNAKNS